jgi:tRNA U34 2-thiouridine synthase MnmA/TrmU
MVIFHTFIAGQIPTQPGEIVDTDGKVLGQHKGLVIIPSDRDRGWVLAAADGYMFWDWIPKKNRLIVGTLPLLFKENAYSE